MHARTHTPEQCPLHHQRQQTEKRGGRQAHQWHHREGIQHLKLLPNGHLLVHSLPPESAEGLEHIGGCTGSLIELDHDSNELWRYDHVYMHHDYQRLENGNTLILRWEKLPANVSAGVKGGFVAATLRNAEARLSHEGPYQRRT